MMRFCRGVFHLAAVCCVCALLEGVAGASDGAEVAWESDAALRCDLAVLELSQFDAQNPPAHPVLLIGWNRSAARWDRFDELLGGEPQLVKDWAVRPIGDQRAATREVLARAATEGVLLFATDSENAPFFAKLDALLGEEELAPERLRWPRTGAGDDRAFRVFSGGRRGSAHGSHRHGASWLAQAVGRKAWLFAPPVVPPTTTATTSAPACFGARPTSPSDRCGGIFAARSRGAPRAAAAAATSDGSECSQCLQHPGEVVWFPKGWWHATCALDDLSLAAGSQLGEPSVPGLVVSEQRTYETASQYYDALTAAEATRRDPSNIETLAVHRWLGPDKSTQTHFELINAELERHLEDRARAPASRRTVLDAGCGLGAGLVWFERRHPTWRLIGVTVSRAQSEYAAKLPVHRFAVLERSYDDLALLPRLDAIFCVEAFVHSPQLDATLGHWARQLVDGGAIAVIDDFLSHDSWVDDELVQRFAKLWLATTLASVERLAAAAEKHGLRLVANRDIGKEYDVLRWNYKAEAVPRSSRESSTRAAAAATALSSASSSPQRHHGFDGGKIRKKLYVDGALEYRLIVLVKQPRRALALASSDDERARRAAVRSTKRRWHIEPELRVGDRPGGGATQQCLSGWYCCGYGPAWVERLEKGRTSTTPFLAMDPQLFSEQYLPAFTKHLTSFFNADDAPTAGKFIDIGGTGSTASGMTKVTSKFAHFAGPLEYWLLDADVAAVGVPNAIHCDVSDCPQAESNSFDVTFSHYVLEHVREPWKAFDTIARITKPGGLALHAVPWSYHFHATPNDYFRFSHEGLASLLQDRGFDILQIGYDLCRKRDTPTPRVDEHFDEIWLLFVVARKRDA